MGKGESDTGKGKVMVTGQGRGGYANVLFPSPMCLFTAVVFHCRQGWLKVEGISIWVAIRLVPSVMMGLGKGFWPYPT